MSASPTRALAAMDEEEHYANDGDEDRPQEEASASTTKRQKRKPRPSELADDRQPGTTAWPVARIQRILKADEDVTRMSKEAVFLVAIATEHFIKRLASQAWLRARLNQKKTLTLENLATVVQQEPEFFFLEDIMPRTVPLSVALAARQAKESESAHLPTYTEPPLTDLIPQGSLHVSTNPDFVGVVAKNERGTHPKRLTISGGGGGTTAAAAAATTASATAAAKKDDDGKENASTRASRRQSRRVEQEEVAPAAPAAPPADEAGLGPMDVESDVESEGGARDERMAE